ncbi:MAG: glycosyltransferase family A protein [Patescibacteria group bacterium]|jgi:glycosyltransferase involved in cell wall biosynthesis
MTPLSISIVIPVSFDRRLAQCLASIDEPVEVVIVLNNHPTPEVAAIAASDTRARIIRVPGSGCNLARVFNLGIEAATHDRVLLMNSDCIFPPGFIRRMAGLLEQSDIAKARVRFAHHTYRQKLVASCRTLFHHRFESGGNLFGPGLAFHKRIRSALGGYFFNEAMGWGEDGELSKRINNAHLPFVVSGEFIEHAPEGMLHDLRTALYIGRGRRRLHISKNISAHQTMVRDVADMLGDRRGHCREALALGGGPLCAYYVAWRIATYVGYYTFFSRRNRSWDKI